MICYSCGGNGHKSFECPNNRCQQRNIEETRWCGFCESSKHDAKECRNKEMKYERANCVNDDNSVDGEEHSFQFSIKEAQQEKDSLDLHNLLLVDSGSTTHVINDKEKFIWFDRNFEPRDHCVELADGNKLKGVVERKGTAKVEMRDSDGKLCTITLTDAMYAPKFPMNVLSVNDAAVKGKADFILSAKSGSMNLPNGTKFPIECRHRQYFMHLQDSQRIHKTHNYEPSRLYAARFHEQQRSYADALKSKVKR